VTVPLPAPALLTVSVKDCMAKVAVTEEAPLSVTVHVPEPLQPLPFQRLKVERAAGTAVKVMVVPLAYAAAQVVPHEMPAGAKVAVTDVAALSVTVHVPVPVQPPLQPLKIEPAAGVAVKVTGVPLANAAAQVVPQAMPAGALVTVPLPTPALLTVSVKVWRA